MKDREQLQEQFEDALFALLMDNFAKAEGEKALAENERLQNDPSAEVPEEVNKRCFRTIRRCFAKQKFNATRQFTFKALGKVAMAVGIAAILFTFAFATSETIRAKTLNLVIEVFDKSTDFFFEEKKSDNSKPQLSLGWVPNGFSLQDQGNNGIATWLQYCGANDAYISVTYEYVEGLVMSVDTEGATTEPIIINDFSALLILKDNENDFQITWATHDNTAFIYLLSYGVSREDLIHVAKELKY